MTEDPVSNSPSDLVAELRDAAIYDVWTLRQKAADEIERLTAERDALAGLSRENVLAAVKDRNDLIAERDRLTDELAQAQNAASIAFDVHSDVRAERDRLRDELANERHAMKNVQECAESYRKWHLEATNRLDSMRDERNRLRSQSELASREAAALRAALEEARDQIIADSPQSAAIVISEALAGAADKSYDPR